MTNHAFRLLAYRHLERLQKLDSRLRQTRAPLEIARLRRIRFSLKDRLARLLRPAAMAR